MDFRTVVDVPSPDFRIGPCESLLFVGSCFADAIGQRFLEEKFKAIVNPYGVMYNPASILHTVQKLVTDSADLKSVKTTFLTLGTNHVYRLKETGEIVDNCQKRPQSLFQEEELSVDECADYLQQAVDLLYTQNPEMHIVLTVSPIRYRKYGYHGSQLSKATLLLAVERLNVNYFPAYEIVNDELRDYRFYQADMLHPSDQAVTYIWERLSDTYLSDEAKSFLKEWAPLKAVLNHKPFNPESEEYQALIDKTMLKVCELQKKYPNFAV
jgi:lysophospholipase L1-like esterase